MNFIFVFLSNLIIAVIFDASKNSLLTLTVYCDQNKRLMKKWPILRQFYTFSLHADINFIYWKCCSLSVNVPKVLSSGKKRDFRKTQNFHIFKNEQKFLFFFTKVFIAFLGVSRHGEPRNSEKTFLEIFWSWPKKPPHDPKKYFF